jgi:hypothetical protein
MSQLRELTGRELDVVSGGFLNNKNWGGINFNNGGTGGAGGSLIAGNNSGNGGSGGAVVGAQIGQQVNGIFSVNGIVG